MRPRFVIYSLLFLALLIAAAVVSPRYLGAAPPLLLVALGECFWRKACGPL